MLITEGEAFAWSVSIWGFSTAVRRDFCCDLGCSFISISFPSLTARGDVRCVQQGVAFSLLTF